MKVVEGFKMRVIGCEHILVPESMELVNFNKMISLNESAAFLWENIQNREFTASDLEKLLLDHYDVTPEVVKPDVENILKSWKEAGLITE